MFDGKLEIHRTTRCFSWKALYFSGKTLYFRGKTHLSLGHRQNSLGHRHKPPERPKPPKLPVKKQRRNAVKHMIFRWNHWFVCENIDFGAKNKFCSKAHLNRRATAFSSSQRLASRNFVVNSIEIIQKDKHEAWWCIMGHRCYVKLWIFVKLLSYPRSNVRF